MAQKLYGSLGTTNQEVWQSGENHTLLLAITRMPNINAKHHLSKRCFNDFCHLPIDNLMTNSFHDPKIKKDKVVQGLILPVENIYWCFNGYMIY